MRGRVSEAGSASGVGVGGRGQDRGQDRYPRLVTEYRSGYRWQLVEVELRVSAERRAPQRRGVRVRGGYYSCVGPSAR